MKRKFKYRVPSLFKLLGVLILLYFLVSVSWTIYYASHKIKKTPQMLLYIFDSQYDKDTVKYKVEYEWVPLDKISQNMVVAVLASQDPNFYAHDGFSLLDPQDSLVSRIPKEHETISQRVAHAVFLPAGDSWVSNWAETYFTILVEYLWGKDRILEVYLNTALMGNGIFGAEAASWIYFRKSAADLTTQEAAYIAAVMDMPSALFQVEFLEDLVLLRQKTILERMGLILHIKKGAKPIDEKELMSPVKALHRRQWRV